MCFIVSFTVLYTMIGFMMLHSYSSMMVQNSIATSLLYRIIAQLHVCVAYQIHKINKQTIVNHTFINYSIHVYLP
jgi:hypothetical protein